MTKISFEFLGLTLLEPMALILNCILAAQAWVYYNRLREEINIEPKFWDKPESMRTRMVSIADYLNGEIDRAREISEDPNKSQKMREGANEAIRDMESYLAKMLPKKIS